MLGLLTLIIHNANPGAAINGDPGAAIGRDLSLDPSLVNTFKLPPIQAHSGKKAPPNPPPHSGEAAPPGPSPLRPHSGETAPPSPPNELPPIEAHSRKKAPPGPPPKRLHSRKTGAAPPGPANDPKWPFGPSPAIRRASWSRPHSGETAPQGPANDPDWPFGPYPAIRRASWSTVHRNPPPKHPRESYLEFAGRHATPPAIDSQLAQARALKNQISTVLRSSRDPGFTRAIGQLDGDLSVLIWDMNYLSLRQYGPLSDRASSEQLRGCETQRRWLQAEFDRLMKEYGVDSEFEEMKKQYATVTQVGKAEPVRGESGLGQAEAGAVDPVSETAMRPTTMKSSLGYSEGGTVESLDPERTLVAAEPAVSSRTVSQEEDRFGTTELLERELRGPSQEEDRCGIAVLLRQELGEGNDHLNAELSGVGGLSGLDTTLRPGQLDK